MFKNVYKSAPLIYIVSAYCNVTQEEQVKINFCRNQLYATTAVNLY